MADNQTDDLLSAIKWLQFRQVTLNQDSPAVLRDEHRWILEACHNWRQSLKSTETWSYRHCTSWHYKPAGRDRDRPSWLHLLHNIDQHLGGGSVRVPQSDWWLSHENKRWHPVPIRQPFPGKPSSAMAEFHLQCNHISPWLWLSWMGLWAEVWMVRDTLRPRTAWWPMTVSNFYFPLCRPQLKQGSVWMGSTDSFTLKLVQSSFNQSSPQRAHLFEFFRFLMATILDQVDRSVFVLETF